MLYIPQLRGALYYIAPFMKRVLSVMSRPASSIEQWSLTRPNGQWFYVQILDHTQCGRTQARIARVRSLLAASAADVIRHTR
jgi:hypothetical protein